MDIPVFAVPERMMLSNGIPVYVLRSMTQPAVRIDVVIRGGQAAQDKLLQALFTNRMLREGTEGMSSADLAERLDNLGSWLEMSVSMGYSFLTLYSLRRCMRESCMLLSDILLAPTFPEIQLEVVRSNNRNQYLVNSRRGDVLARRLLYTDIYGVQHPCGHFAEVKDFDAITREDLLRYYRRSYTPSHTSLYLAGDIDDEVLEVIETCFGKWYVSDASCIAMPSGAFNSLTVDSSRSPHLPVVRHLPTQVQTSLRLCCLMMPVDTDDFYRMQVVTTLLGGFFGSRLMKRVREELGYTYGIQADMVTNTRQALFEINAEVVSEKADAVVSEVHCEMERLCTELVSDEELLMTRNYMLGDICRNYEGAFSLIDAYIYIHTMGLPEEYIQRIARVASEITPALLLETAQRWLNTNDLHTAIVVP